MKTRETMPKEFVDSFYKKPPTIKPPPTESPGGEDPVPIGPK
jgi:hypothetical protein